MVGAWSEDANASSPRARVVDDGWAVTESETSSPIASSSNGSTSLAPPNAPAERRAYAAPARNASAVARFRIRPRDCLRPPPPNPVIREAGDREGEGRTARPADRTAAGDAIAGPGRQSSSSPHASPAAAPHSVEMRLGGVPLPRPTRDERPPPASDAPLALDKGAIAFPLSQSPPSPSLMSSQSSAPIAFSAPRAMG